MYCSCMLCCLCELFWLLYVDSVWGLMCIGDWWIVCWFWVIFCWDLVWWCGYCWMIVWIVVIMVFCWIWLLLLLNWWICLIGIFWFVWVVGRFLCSIFWWLGVVFCLMVWCVVCCLFVVWSGFCCWVIVFESVLCICVLLCCVGSVWFCLYWVLVIVGSYGLVVFLWNMCVDCVGWVIWIFCWFSDEFGFLWSWCGVGYCWLCNVV